MGGQDIKWSEEHVMAGKKFCNKIWNAARFVLGQCPPSSKSDFGSQKKSDFFLGGKTVADKKIIVRLRKTQKQVNKLIEKYDFGKALHILYEFFWHDFCDIYLEESKKNPNPEVLARALKESLKLLHPFMPFITETVWQKFNRTMLMTESWIS